MASTKLQKPHAVLIPYPAQGHINPLMQFAKILQARGIHITFVNTEFTHKRLIQTAGPDSVQNLPDFRFETVPDGLPPDDKESRGVAALVVDSTRKHSVVPLKELIIKLNSLPDVPPVSCIVSDGVMSYATYAAKQLGIPEARIWTASACGLMGYNQYAELVKRRIIPLEDESYKTNGYLDTPLDWVPGMKDMRLRDMPSFCITTDPEDLMVKVTIEQMVNCTQSCAMIMNTFYELEKEVLDALASYFPPLYTIGPLTKLVNSRSSQNSQDNNKNNDKQDLSLWKKDTECLDWINKRQPKSVVYVNFGSIAILTEEEIKAYAIGLASCGFDFLWVLRPDIVKGNKAILPQGFVEETKERGLVVSWCPQEKVLNHPSVGLFLTHAGWNSMLESLTAGVPVLCWAHAAEQTTNSRQVSLVWKNGMEIGKNVNGIEVAELIREMMVGEKGKEKREKALEWKKKAEEATSEGGHSYVSLDKLINEVFFRKN